MPSRPAVDVVLPFYGTEARLEVVVGRLGALELQPGDTVTIADNRPDARDRPARGAVRVLGAGERQTSYHARNRAAAIGSAAWLVFVDSDVIPPPDLLDRYFARPPAVTVAVLAGAVVDAEPEGPGAAAERYAFLKSSMSQEPILARGDWGFAQTANAAVRRDAFAAVGGFEAGVRSGGDADLCFRIRAAGWAIEARPEAAVVHHNRATVPRMLAQRFRHGSGSGWLQRRHPGSLPPRRWPGLLWWGVRRGARGLAAAARGDRDAALLGLLDGPAVWAFELGRLVPNRSLRRARRG